MSVIVVKPDGSQTELSFEQFGRWEELQERRDPHVYPIPRPSTRRSRLMAEVLRRVLRTNPVLPPPRHWRHDMLLTILWTDCQEDDSLCRCEFCVWGRALELLAKARLGVLIRLRGIAGPPPSVTIKPSPVQ